MTSTQIFKVQCFSLDLGFLYPLLREVKRGNSSQQAEGELSNNSHPGNYGQNK